MTTTPINRPDFSAHEENREPSSNTGLRSLALFEEEQLYLAPGLQSIALFSKIAVARGSGSLLIDEDGREYVDFAAGIGVASIGHAHPEYVRQVSDQLAKVSVGSFTSQARVRFARSFSEIAPETLKRVQLYSSGAEAVEAAIRLAKSRTQKYEIIGFWGGFHGKTGGVMGILGGDFKQKLGPLMPGLYLSPYPNPYRCPLGTTTPHDCAAHCLEFLRQMIQMETTGSVAAIIVEPIQGTAGNVLPAPGFLKGVREIAREHEALWISDEMITGFGRTGHWFGFQHESVLPDIMTIGKGMAGGFPVSGIATSSEIAESLPFAQPSGSSSSYGGNPLASAAAAATLDVLRREDLPQHANEMGAYMLQRLKALQQKHQCIGDVRGRGLLIGVELVTDRRTRAPLPKNICRALFEESLGRGLLAMSYTPVIRINPPLNIPKDLVDRGIDALDESLAAVSSRFGV